MKGWLANNVGTVITCGVVLVSGAGAFFGVRGEVRMLSQGMSHHENQPWHDRAGDQIATLHRKMAEMEGQQRLVLTHLESEHIHQTPAQKRANMVEELKPLISSLDGLRDRVAQQSAQVAVLSAQVEDVRMELKERNK